MKSVESLPSVDVVRDAGALVLEPGVLDALTLQAEAALLRQGESENTLRSYRSALRYWAAWFALRYGRPISVPVATETVVQFLVDHVQRDRDGELVSELPAAVDQALVSGGFKGHLGAPAMSTVIHRVAVLSKLHQLQGVENPCDQTRVRELLGKARRGYAKRGALPSKKPALTREPLEALLETCDASLIGLRDRALLLFAFGSGGRRRSEVVAATMENTRRVGDGYVYSLVHSKTNQFGADRPENHKPVAGRAAHALTAWLAASKIKSGAIFRRVHGAATLGAALSPAAVRDIVKKRCQLAGLEEGFSAHSLRSGFVTEAGLQGVPLGETMALTGHRTAASVVGYFRAGYEGSQAAKLLDS